MAASDSESRLEVASSRIRMRGSARMGHSGFQGHVTRAVNGIGRSLLCVAHNAVVDFRGCDAGSLDGFDGGDGGEFLGGEVAQLAAVASHGCARTVDDCDFRK